MRELTVVLSFPCMPWTLLRFVSTQLTCHNQIKAFTVFRVSQLRCLLLLSIIFVSAGNLQSQASRSPHKGTVAWDLQSSKHSPIKMVGMATSVPSSQTSPALVNALFERVEEQAEVSAQYHINFIN